MIKNGRLYDHWYEKDEIGSENKWWKIKMWKIVKSL